MGPKISLVICAFNMPRELPRTIRSLSPGMQQGVAADDYEIIVVDNGSTKPFDEAECRQWGADLRVLRIDPASASLSPARALNTGIAHARGRLIGAFIDGARLASPGIVRFAAMADKLSERAVILTLGFHLGREMQMTSVHKGYDAAQEDRLLARARWSEDGYRLFDIAVLAGSSHDGWFSAISESNAIFMRATLWRELGNFDEKFQAPGGGLLNLDTLARAVALPQVVVITLLGEGNFHQVHGGAATNAIHPPWSSYHDEYLRIRGRAFERPVYDTIYVGSVPVNALSSIAASAQRSLATRLSKAES